MKKLRNILLLAITALCITSCDSMYYTTTEPVVVVERPYYRTLPPPPPTRYMTATPRVFHPTPHVVNPGRSTRGGNQRGGRR